MESKGKRMSTAAIQSEFVDFQSDWAELDLPEIGARSAERGAAGADAGDACSNCWTGRWAGRREIPTGRLGNRDDHGAYEAVFQAPGAGRVVEAVITKARNGLAINFPDPAMRRRDPDAMVIGDKLPTDKPTYKQRFGEAFEKTRQQTLDWLKTQELVAMPFYAGTDALGYGSRC